MIPFFQSTCNGHFLSELYNLDSSLQWECGLWRRANHNTHASCGLMCIVSAKHPESDRLSCYSIAYKRKAGYLGLRSFVIRGLPQPKQVNEQNDTHAVGICDTPVKACVRLHEPRHAERDG